MTDASPSCALADCNVDNDGGCKIGADPANCPNRSKRPLIVDDEEGADDFDEISSHNSSPDTDTEAQEETGNLIVLGSGIRLGLGDAQAIASEVPSQLISFIAPKDSGKTSLIAGLYELFLEGRTKDIRFHSSQTVLGFERLCHLSRAVSGRITSDMERTRRAEGLGYFHLCVTRSDGRQGLLLGDRPGENFITAAESLENARALRELSHVSALVYLIDGDVLADPKRKGVPRSTAISILDAISQSNVLSDRPKLVLVLTKQDIAASAQNTDAIAHFDRIVSDFKARYGSSFNSISSFKTSASPKAPATSLDRGAGLLELMEELFVDRRVPFQRVRTKPSRARMFAKLGLPRKAQA